MGSTTQLPKERNKEIAYSIGSEFQKSGLQTACPKVSSRGQQGTVSGLFHQQPSAVTDEIHLTSTSGGSQEE